MTTNIMAFPLMLSLVDYAWVLIMLAFTVLTSTKANLVFAGLFAFRYTRLIINIIAYYGIYKPTPIPANPTIYPRDCTVIIPTVDPENAGFQECIRTVLENKPGAVLIVTVGKEKLKLIKRVVKPLQDSWPATTISATASDIANKRLQVCHAIPQVKTTLTVLVDDHVYWPSTNFLPTICAPFEDSKVGGLGTNKIVRRAGSGYNLSSIFNFWGCLYLERHNFELTATNAIDGSVFVLSGRTSAHRTSILQDKEFLAGFSNEMFFFGKYGPIAADDDNFITRWEVKKGWNIKFQNCPDATIETDLGEPHKFLSQCMRWVRTTWRSNSCSLFTDRTVWRRQPWGVYAIYISSFFNFALAFDSALLYTLTQTTYGQTWHALFSMAAWIFASKMIKLIPHLRRNPADILLIPAYLAFAYFHSFMKFWALLTFWDIQWSGRNLAQVNNDAQNDGDDDDDSDDNDDDDDDDDDDTPDMSGWDLNADQGYAACEGPSHYVSYAPSRASSVASSTGSASYAISKWSQWEKASMDSNSVLRSRWPSSSLPAVSEQQHQDGSNSPRNGSSLDAWLQRDVRSGSSASSSSSAHSKSTARPLLSNYLHEPSRSPSPFDTFPSDIPPSSVAMPANPIDVYEVSASDTTTSRHSSISSRTRSSTTRGLPTTRFLGQDLSSNNNSSGSRSSLSYSSSSGSSSSGSSSGPRSSRHSSFHHTLPRSPFAPGPNATTAAWSTSPIAPPSGYRSSSASDRASDSALSTNALDTDATSPLTLTLTPTPKPKPIQTIRPALNLSSPPRPRPAALVPAPSKSTVTRQMTRPTTTTTKRTRGADCGRQHAEGHRITGQGMCALPGYVGDVGLSYYEKRERRL